MNIFLVSSIAAAPAQTGDNSVSIGLVIVGIVAAIATGAAVAVSALRRRDAEFSLPERASLRGIVGASSRRERPNDTVEPGSRDQLTGLANRRRLDHDVMAHANRRGITAVMMISVDQYDDISDKYGPRAANRLVREIGDVLSRNIRFDDVVYRYGDKEFCVLLPEATVAEGHLVAARLIDAAHQLELRDGRNATISIGVAGTNDGRVNRALTSADLALLEAKKSGHDQATSFPL